MHHSKSQTSLNHVSWYTICNITIHSLGFYSQNESNLIHAIQKHGNIQKKENQNGMKRKRRKKIKEPQDSSQEYEEWWWMKSITLWTFVV